MAQVLYCCGMPLHTDGGSLSVADLYPAPSTPGEEAYLAIRRSILEGMLRPGERIVEQQLAEMLSVSRTPVREALLKLERENLVARIGRGMAVRRYSSDEVRDIYNLRAHLESFAARIAADRITEGELAALSQIQDEMERERFDKSADAIRVLSRDNQRFHALVVRCARNAPLDRCFGQVFHLPLLYKAYVYFDEERRQRSDRDHRELVEMLRAGNSAAAEEHWRSHLQRGGETLAQHLAAGEVAQL
jgi:DNA-binding GntR family transcriptional regulator